jgi:hypothetical protein
MTPKEQEAFDKGRLQGLREMDEAYGQSAIPKSQWAKVGKLRLEYTSD